MLAVVLTSRSLRMSGITPCTYWPFVYLLWANVYSFFHWVVFLLLNYGSSCYIPDAGLLLDVCIVNFFSLSVDSF